jgi:hypothetical protein
MRLEARSHGRKGDGDMRVGIVTDMQGQRLGTITEQDDGTLVGEGKGERLLAQAPLKTFDDWINTIHHSTYLRFEEVSPDEASA